MNTPVHASLQDLFGPTATITNEGGEYYLSFSAEHLGEDGWNVLDPAALNPDGLFMSLIQRWFLKQGTSPFRMVEITRVKPYYRLRNGENVKTEEFNIQVFGSTPQPESIDPDGV
jgi:hypothetical protein